MAVFSAFYTPAYRAGGPIVSVSRIVENEKEACVRVITSDRDFRSDTPHPNAQTRNWVPVGRARVAYLRPGARDWPWVIRQLRDWQPDLLYFNSLQSPWFSLLPHLLHRMGLLPATRVLLAPRGETSPGALQLKGLKKRLARPLLKRLLNHPLTWHASSEKEQKEIEAWWGAPLLSSHSWRVASNPAAIPAPAPSQPPFRDRPRIVFASRIDRMKGLLELLQAMQFSDVEVDLHVHGAVTDERYWRECREETINLPANIHFRYCGEYSPVQVASIMSDADLFALPTYGENFGHVIAEALSVGCPVAIPGTTLWSNLVENSAGWIISGSEDLSRVISEFARLDHNQRLDQRKSAHAAYSDWFATENDGYGLFCDTNAAPTVSGAGNDE